MAGRWRSLMAACLRQSCGPLQLDPRTHGILADVEHRFEELRTRIIRQLIAEPSEEVFVGRTANVAEQRHEVTIRIGADGQPDAPDEPIERPLDRHLKEALHVKFLLVNDTIILAELNSNGALGLGDRENLIWRVKVPRRQAAMDLAARSALEFQRCLRH